ncbi:MAG: hypothetical protein HUU04_06180 [Verrucomicrobiae bacterium]|nr:hypothetical protein [Verrucomicrobiae bacterium]
MFYGATRVRKDVDFLLLADAGSDERLRSALDILGARHTAVPPLSP